MVLKLPSSGILLFLLKDWFWKWNLVRKGWEETVSFSFCIFHRYAVEYLLSC